MAKTGDVHALYSCTTGKPLGTIRDAAKSLTKHGLLPPTKPGRGAIGYDTGAAVNLLIATLVAPTAITAAETVERVGSLRLRFIANAAEGIAAARALGIDPIMDTFATVLRVTVDAIRRGDLLEGSVLVDLYTAGRNATISFLPKEGKDFGMFYGADEKPAPVTTFVRVENQVFQDLAATLGPLPTAALSPPPY
jgi:hypothetical protein